MRYGSAHEPEVGLDHTLLRLATVAHRHAQLLGVHALVAALAARGEDAGADALAPAFYFAVAASLADARTRARAAAAAVRSARYSESATS